MTRLKRSFFQDHPKKVAPQLLGKYLVVNYGLKKIVTKIIETEAYGGKEDKACHVGRYGYTERTKPLFGKIGHAYVYSVHINTYCLNVVCHKENQAGGILIRALEPIEGIDLILKNLNKKIEENDIKKILNGPGKLCKALGINKSFSGLDMVQGEKIYFLEGENVSSKHIISTPRINIPYAGISKNWRWRFIINNSASIS